MPHSSTNIESREIISPSKELFDGEIKLMEKPMIRTFSVKVDGIPTTFNIPKKTPNDPLFSGFWEMLKKENVIYSPTTKSFHSLNASRSVQAKEFLTLSYTEALQRFPRHLQPEFTQEAFIKSRSIAQDVLTKKIIPIGGFLLNSLFFTEIHKNSSNLRSYTKSAAGFVGFEAGAIAGAIAGARYAPSVWRIPAALVGGAFGATGALLLEDSDLMDIQKTLWKKLPQHASALEKNSYTTKILTIDPALLYTTNVDPSDNPVEWTSGAKRRDALKWNTSLDVFQKKLVIDIAVLARSFREGTGVFDKKDGLEYIDEEGIKRTRPKKLMTKKEKEEVLGQELRKLLVDKTNPMFQQQAVSFANEIFAAIIGANGQKIDEFSTQLGPIIEQQTSVFITTMKIPKSFKLNDKEKNYEVNAFDGGNDMSEKNAEGYAIFAHRDQLFNNIGGMLKSIRKTIDDNKPGELNRPGTFENIKTYVARIMSGENPLGADRSWNNNILSDPTPIAIEVGGVKQTKPLGDILVVLFNEATEFRRINKWMHLMNKNGNGHEWKVI